MNPQIVEKDEWLYRRCPPDPMYWKRTDNTTSSILFKTDALNPELSVDRDGSRMEDDIVKHILTDHEMYGVAKAQCHICITCGASFFPSPLAENQFHAGIYGSPQKEKVNRGLAKKMEKEFIVVQAPILTVD